MIDWGRMMKRVRSEEGWVLVVAVSVMSIMLVTGLATLKIVDTQSQASGGERIRESSFNLAEGLLYSEANILQRNWPRKAPCSPLATGCGYDVAGSGTAAYQCTDANATLNPTQCPNPAELFGPGKVFSNTDDSKSATWRIQIRDNSGSSAVVYDKSQVDAPTTAACVAAAGVTTRCAWDKNADRRVWVRVDATVNGKTRMLVALLQLEQFAVPFPHNAVVAGSLSISNSGNKTVVNTAGSQVVVRCTPAPATTTTATPPVVGGASLVVPVSSATGIQPNMYMVLDSGLNAETVQVSSAYSSGATLVPLTAAVAKSHPTGSPFVIAPGPQGKNVTVTNTCEGWDSGASAKNQTPQVSPQYNYSSNSAYPSGLTLAQLPGIELGADTVYDGSCPSDANGGAAWKGRIYIVNPPGGGCIMNPTNSGGSSDINSLADPGWIIVQNGTFQIQGNTNYYGVVYCANQTTPPSTGVVLTIASTAQVIGGVAVDGPGQVSLGQNLAVTFYDNAFNSFSASGAAGLVQNSWRELAVGQ
jgi:Tfp pilus assembly protein PilX